MNKNVIEILIIIIICVINIITVIRAYNELYKLEERKKIITSLYQNECEKTDTLWRIIKHIRGELCMLNFKDCPDSEKIDIPNEIIEWIDKLEFLSGEAKQVSKEDE